ncbi:hypothetical protein DIPPA_02745 [Diplonema papillatum]|nr:hypothetical protein DIPPA_02745 [Diplonema papillatum]
MFDEWINMAVPRSEEHMADKLTIELIAFHHAHLRETSSGIPMEFARSVLASVDIDLSADFAIDDTSSGASTARP